MSTARQEVGAGDRTTAPSATSPGDAVRVSWLVGTLFGLGITSSSAVAVVLPILAVDLSMSPSLTAWMLSGFALTLAVFTPTYGRLADRVGIRGPLIAGMVLMSAGALTAALAPTAEVAIVARLVQGAGGAAVPVLALALVSQRYEGRERAGALARVAGLSAAIAAVAPLLAGALEAVAGWRPVLALPALGLLLLVPLYPVVSRDGREGPFDVAGAVYVAATVSGVILLAQAPASGPVVVVTGALLLLGGLPLLVRHVRRHPEGFLPRAVLANRWVTTGAVGTLGLQSAWFALLLLIPAALASYGWTPLGIGAALLPGAGAALLATRTSGPLLDRVGTRAMLVLSALAAMAALSLGALGLAAASPVLLMAAFTCTSWAYASGQPAMISQVSAHTAAEVRGVAVGLATLVMLTGAALGSALIGGLQPVLPPWAQLVATAVLPLLGIAVVVVGRSRDPSTTPAPPSTDADPTARRHP